MNIKSVLILICFSFVYLIIACGKLTPSEKNNTDLTSVSQACLPPHTVSPNASFNLQGLNPSPYVESCPEDQKPSESGRQCVCKTQGYGIYQSKCYPGKILIRLEYIKMAQSAGKLPWDIDILTYALSEKPIPGQPSAPGLQTTSVTTTQTRCGATQVPGPPQPHGSPNPPTTATMTSTSTSIEVQNQAHPVTVPPATNSPAYVFNMNDYEFYDPPGLLICGPFLMTYKLKGVDIRGVGDCQNTLHQNRPLCQCVDPSRSP